MQQHEITKKQIQGVELSVISEESDVENEMAIESEKSKDIEFEEE